MKEPLVTAPANSLKIAIIGTGPASLLKAYLLAKKNTGCQITLLDQSPQAGGAWYSDQSPQGHEIECGCHIWSYVPQSYRFIQKELGVKLYPVKPAPVFAGSKIKVPYSVKNTIDSYKTLIKMLVTLRWNQLKNLKHDPNIQFRIFGKRNLYPKSGSPELIHALLEKVNRFSNITLQLNTNVKACHINDSGVSLETQNGTQTFDKIYLTYVSRMDQLMLHGKHFPVHVKQVDYIHFLIRTDKPLLKKMTYRRLINDPIVHRITDISSQTNFEENLMLIGIKDKAYHASDEKTLLEHCHTLFKKSGLIDDSFVFEKIKTHLFPTHYLGEETLAELKKHEPVVSLMHTTDLMHGFYFLLKENGG